MILILENIIIIIFANRGLKREKNWILNNKTRVYKMDIFLTSPQTRVLPVVKDINHSTTKWVCSI
jgi:hypothetical protein